MLCIGISRSGSGSYFELYRSWYQIFFYFYSQQYQFTLFFFIYLFSFTGDIIFRIFGSKFKFLWKNYSLSSHLVEMDTDADTEPNPDPNRQTLDADADPAIWCLPDRPDRIQIRIHNTDIFGPKFACIILYRYHALSKSFRFYSESYQ